MGKTEKRIKKVLKILKNAEVLSDKEYLVDKISIHQLYLLSCIQISEYSTNKSLKKRTSTSVFLEPEEGNVLKISFQKVITEKSFKEYNKKHSSFIDKKLNKFKKRFIFEGSLNGSACYNQNFDDETASVKDKKSFIYVNSNNDLEFKIKYQANRDAYYY